MTIAPDTSYARSGDVQIAYQIRGEGKLDLALVGGPASHLDVIWENPAPAATSSVSVTSPAWSASIDAGPASPTRSAAPRRSINRPTILAAVMDAVGLERAAHRS